MSISVLCHGCGQVLEVGDDYRRNKIRCPHCGVFCEVPASAKKKKAPTLPAAADEAADLLLESDPDVSATAAGGREEAEAAPVDRAAEKKEKRPKRPRPAGDLLLTCPECGEQVRLTAPVHGQKRKCPCCGTILKEPARKPPPKPDPSPKATPAAVEQPFPTSDKDDGLPYAFGERDRICPRCLRIMPPAARICIDCGVDLEDGVKVTDKKLPPPLERSWDTGWPAPVRRGVFAAAQAVALLLGLAGAVLGGYLVVFVVSWFFFTLMTSFLLGTWDRIDLKRDKRNRVTLTKTWHAGFVPQPTAILDWGACETIVTSRTNEPGCFEWFVFFFLFFGCGVVPGILWWYFVIHRDTFQVALARDHGYAAVIVYRGGSQEQMEDIAATLKDVTGLPRQVG